MKELPLTKGHVALVDDADFAQMSRFKWSALVGPDGRVYAKRNERGTIILLHRQLMGVTEFREQVDHRDGNGLNNSRQNLRVCTQAQNGANQRIQRRSKSSSFKGVSWHHPSRGNGYWRAYIWKGGKRTHLGLFESQRDAALAYNRAAIETFGEFALLNKVPEP